MLDGCSSSCQPCEVLGLGDGSEDGALVHVLSQIELVSNLIRVLDQADSCLVQADFKKFHEFSNKAEDLILEDIGADGATAVDEEDEVGLLLWTGGLNCADPPRWEISRRGDIHKPGIALKL